MNNDNIIFKQLKKLKVLKQFRKDFDESMKLFDKAIEAPKK